LGIVGHAAKLIKKMKREESRVRIREYNGCGHIGESEYGNKKYI